MEIPYSFRKRGFRSSFEIRPSHFRIFLGGSIPNQTTDQPGSHSKYIQSLMEDQNEIQNEIHWRSSGTFLFWLQRRRWQNHSSRAVELRQKPHGGFKIWKRNRDGKLKLKHSVFLDTNTRHSFTFQEQRSGRKDLRAHGDCHANREPKRMGRW